MAPNLKKKKKNFQSMLHASAAPGMSCIFQDDGDS